jgi:hypothetical protein
MTLFNTRREHEWKIFFGVITLLVGLDAAKITRGFELEGCERCAWLCLVAALTVAGYWYEWGLQRRNSSDRRAMNILYNGICDAIRVPDRSPIREEPEYSMRSASWAALPKALVLLSVFLFSAALPWLKLSIPQK